MAKVKPVPEGYPVVTPSLCVDGANDAIEFYKSVFGATERMRMDDGGKVGHAELQLGDSVIMLNDEYPDMDVLSPKSVGGTPIRVCIYVDDVDATVAKAEKAGGKVKRPVQDQFYGDRSGEVEDPWGHRWNVATHIEDVSPKEMEERAAKWMAEQQ